MQREYLDRVNRQGENVDRGRQAGGIFGQGQTGRGKRGQGQTWRENTRTRIDRQAQNMDGADRQGDTGIL
jgi:hypothetical protein